MSITELASIPEKQTEQQPKLLLDGKSDTQNQIYAVQQVSTIEYYIVL
jgi:hypothetical protein